jgi:hypothetical protein
MISGENIKIKMLKDGQLPRQTSIDKNIYQMVVCAR